MSHSQKYHRAVVGGTFDRLHDGHKKILMHAFNVAEFVVIGITDNDYTKQKQLPKVVLDYTKRQSQVRRFLEQEGLQGRFHLVSISDKYGTTLQDHQLEAIVVTSETVSAVNDINNKREQKGLSPLVIELVPFVNDQANIPIASTRIRQGIVSNQGIIYSHVFNRDIELTSQQKQILKKPMGHLYSQEFIKHDSRLAPYPIRAIVGDTTLKLFVKEDLPFSYGAYDGKTQRQKSVTIDLPDLPTQEVENQAGMISHQAVDGIRHLLQQDRGFLKVTGEEDLMVLPFLLFLPLGSEILYGQPDEGIVVVDVDEENKDKWYRFLLDTGKIS